MCGRVITSHYFELSWEEFNDAPTIVSVSLLLTMKKAHDEQPNIQVCEECIEKARKAIETLFKPRGWKEASR